LDGGRAIQILVAGYTRHAGNEQALVVAIDRGYEILWRGFLDQGAGWSEPAFACGDFTGNSTKEWVIVDGGGDGMLVSLDGQLLGRFAFDGKPDEMTVLDAEPHAKLVTRLGSRVSCCSFLPARR
jgi:hypothetical protein